MSQRRFRTSAGNLTRLGYVVILTAMLSFVCGFSAPYLLPVIQDVPIIQMIQIVDCENLPEPLGGNNRSILSSSINAQALDLDLRLDKDTFAVGEAIAVNLVYNNQDNGPIVLYFNGAIQPPISLNDTYTGLMFEIERVGGAALIDQNGHPAAAIPFARQYLRLLGSRARCSINYTLSGERLQLAGLTPGEYRIRAVYNNTSAGIRPAEELNPPIPTPTPFPDYRNDQNVWVGRGSSNEIRFTVTDQIPAPS